jgi:inactivated superfamily I helicase
MIMYVRIVTFALAGITADDYQRHTTTVAAAFTAWPGLLGKVWLSDRDRNRYGGVYLFATKADADRSRSTPLFAGLAANPAFTDLAIEEYETLPEATAVTWPGLRGLTEPALAAVRTNEDEHAQVPELLYTR